MATASGVTSRYNTSVENWDCRGCVHYCVGCSGYPADIKKCLAEKQKREKGGEE